MCGDQKYLGRDRYGFFLPDLQEKFARGWGKDESINPQRIFESEQIDILEGHRHGLSLSGKCQKLV